MHEEFIRRVRANPECEPIETMRAFTNRILSMWGAAAPEGRGAELAAVVDELVGLYDDAIQAADPWADLLGPVYTELASPAQISGAGQFFTPPGVAEAMVAVQVPTRPEPRPGERLVRVCDPAVGCGGLLLAFTRHVAAHWPEQLPSLSLEGGDVVHLAAEIAAIQLVANCNVHGPSLGEVVIRCENALDAQPGGRVIVHASGGIREAVEPRQSQAHEKRGVPAGPVAT